MVSIFNLPCINMQHHHVLKVPYLSTNYKSATFDVKWQQSPSINWHQLYSANFINSHFISSSGLDTRLSYRITSHAGLYFPLPLEPFVFTHRYKNSLHTSLQNNLSSPLSLLQECMPASQPQIARQNTFMCTCTYFSSSLSHVQTNVLQCCNSHW